MKTASTIIFFVLLPLYVNAQILFEDNFDNQSDWHSKQGADSISWPSTYSGTCTTYCPPGGWTAYRVSRTLFSNDTLDTYVIDSASAYGGSGKGLTYNIESTGGYNTWTADNYSSTWVGGGMNVYLGNGTNYDELYVQYKMKYKEGWRWNHPDHLFKHVEWKMIGLDSYKCTIPGTCTNHLGNTCDPVARYPSGGGCVEPAAAIAQYFNASTSGQSNTNPIVRPMISIRRAPVYNSSLGPLNWTQNLPQDNNWHTYEFNVKMNSAPGVADGCVKMYVDGTLINSNCSIDWEMSDTPSDFQAIGWNWISFFDNITISAHDIAEQQHQQLYFDDVVVSTEYIGPSYIIGGGIPKLLKLIPGQAKQVSGTGRLQ